MGSRAGAAPAGHRPPPRGMVASLAALALCALPLAGCGSSQAPAELAPSIEPTMSVQASASPSAFGGGTASTSSGSPAAVALSITPQSRSDLDTYSTFAYSTAVTTGLSADAAQRANAALADFVDVVDEAVKANAAGCGMDSSPCGSFEQQLLPETCVDGLLCVRQSIDAVWPGAKTGEKLASTLVLDPASGSPITLTEHIGAEMMPQLVASLRQVAKSWQERNGLYDPAMPYVPSASDVTAWLPKADGIHIWMPEYTVVPGAGGVVELTVPDPRSATAPAPEVDPRAGWKRLTNVTSDPVYVSWTRYDDQPDGSTLLTVAPQSPDTLNRDADCTRAEFKRPKGVFCLADTSSRARQVTLVPNATLLANGDPVTFGQLLFYVNQGDKLVSLSLDPDGFANAINATEKIDGPPASTGDQASGSESASPSPQGVTVPNVIGLGNRQAQRAMSSAGLTLQLSVESDDPSIAAQLRGLCQVTSQSIKAGTVVAPGAQIQGTMDCPASGDATPAPPQPWGGLG